MPAWSRRHCLTLTLVATGARSLSALAAADGPAAADMDRRLAAFLELADTEDLALNPQAAVLRGDLRHAADFGDGISDAWLARAQATLRDQIARFAAIDRRALSPAYRVAYDVWAYQSAFALRQHTRGHTRITARWPLDPVFGQHLQFAQFSSGTSGAPYRRVQDYDDGLSRLTGFVRYLDRCIARMREGIRSGHVLPRGAAGTLLGQFEAALAQPLGDSPFLGPLAVMPDSFSATERERLTNAYREAVATQVRPAYERVRDFLRREYLPQARRGAPGLLAVPGGRAYSDDQRESHTTLRQSAEEIHRIGLAEVAQIHRDMRQVQQRLGVPGPLQALFEHLKTDPRYQPTSAEALLDTYRRIGARVAEALPRFFDRLPRSTLQIAPVPVEQQGSASGAYYIVGTPDGSRPGVFYVNTSDLPSRTLTRATALYLHEALPGHHLQGSLAQEDDTLPALLRFGWNAGYGEGWALYAEWLGHEMGLYDDPAQHLGQLDMAVFRAARLVVDTGLHHFGWRERQAVDYLVTHTSLERRFCEQEVERYLVWPGQACAYTLGERRIRTWRRRAEQTLGTRFDVRAFHRAVLAHGALPLAVLDRTLDDWIRSHR